MSAEAYEYRSPAVQTGHDPGRYEDSCACTRAWVSMHPLPLDRGLAMILVNLSTAKNPGPGQRVVGLRNRSLRYTTPRCSTHTIVAAGGWLHLNSSLTTRQKLGIDKQNALLHHARSSPLEGMNVEKGQDPGGFEFRRSHPTRGPAETFRSLIAYMLPQTES